MEFQLSWVKKYTNLNFTASKIKKFSSWETKNEPVKKMSLVKNVHLEQTF
mgnify:CR=1 FL=1